MMKNSYKVLFLMILISGTMVSVSSNSWMGAWIGLEINLLAFIPLMSTSMNLMSNEASLKYFLTQALASSVLLFSVILSMLKLSSMQTYQLLANTSILSSLIMKTGAAPFHFWFPSVMEGLSWMNCIILMTWQKIAPLMLISYMMIKTTMFLAIVLSVMLGSLGGLNQTSLRKLMAFSSINHLGWMLSAMITSEILWITYMTVYSFISINVVIMFYSFNLTHINQMFSTFFDSKYMKFTSMMNLLSLGGLPPFLGFLPKWLVIQSLTMTNQIILTIMIVTFTLITLFFYLRLGFSAFMLNYSESTWITKTEFKNPTTIVFMIMSFISIFTLTLISIIYMML